MKMPPRTLLDGYDRFRSGRYKQDADKYAALGQGQSPKSMIIACADSRVDPTTIFDAGPGDLFIVRNVANIVPPCQPLEASLQGVSAALQFAVESLKSREYHRPRPCWLRRGVCLSELCKRPAYWRLYCSVGRIA